MHPRLHCCKLFFSFLTRPSLPCQWLCTYYLLLHRSPLCHLVIPVHTYSSRLSSNNSFLKTLPWNLQEQILTHPCSSSPQCTLLLQLLSHNVITVCRHLPLFSCDCNKLKPIFLSLASVCIINPQSSIPACLQIFQWFPIYLQKQVQLQ